MSANPAPRKKRGKRKNLAEPESLSTIVDRFRKQGQPRDSSGFPLGTWVAAVGERIADRARPVRLDGGTLTVMAATSAWCAELSHLSATILEQLRKHGVEVHTIRTRVGAVPRLERPPSATRVVPVRPLVELPRELHAALGKLEDESLRDAFAEAMRMQQGYMQATASERSRRAKR